MLWQATMPTLGTPRGETCGLACNKLAFHREEPPLRTVA
jgi:hypothetical protein